MKNGYPENIQKTSGIFHTSVHFQDVLNIQVMSRSVKDSERFLDVFRIPISHRAKL